MWLIVILCNAMIVTGCVIMSISYRKSHEFNQGLGSNNHNRRRFHYPIIPYVITTNATSNSCNTCTSALPDMYTWCPMVCSARGWVHTYQAMQCLCCNYLWALKICLNFIANYSTYFYQRSLLWHFNSNVYLSNKSY